MGDPPERGLQSATKIALAVLAIRIKGLEGEIEALDVKLAALVRDTGTDLLELCGFGTQVAGTLLISAGDSPERLVNEASAARLWA